MPIPATYAAPFFDVYGNCTFTDLETVKGSGLATTDLPAVREAAILTADVARSIRAVYLGDNAGGTGVVKTGHFVQNAAVTFNDPSSGVGGLSGMRGKGTISTWTFNANVTDASPGLFGNGYVPGHKVTANGMQFTNIYGFTPLSNFSFYNTVFYHAYYALMFPQGSAALPSLCDLVTFTGCTAAIYDTTLGNPVDWLTFFAQNRMTFTGNASGHSQINIRFGTTSGITRSLYAEFSPFMKAYRKILRGLGIGGNLR